jgi:hypothetical protein
VRSCERGHGCMHACERERPCMQFGHVSHNCPCQQL